MSCLMTLVASIIDNIAPKGRENSSTISEGQKTTAPKTSHVLRYVADITGFLANEGNKLLIAWPSHLPLPSTGDTIAYLVFGFLFFPTDTFLFLCLALAFYPRYPHMFLPFLSLLLSPSPFVLFEYAFSEFPSALASFPVAARLLLFRSACICCITANALFSSGSSKTARF
jgi:hypothetical protein